MKEKNFRTPHWESSLPLPVFEAHPEYTDFYRRAWQIARAHVKEIRGLPQTPYMDEGFCDTQIWIWDTCFMSLFCKYAGDVFPGVESFRNFYQVLYEGKALPAVNPTEKEPAWTGATPGVPFSIQVHIADNPPLFAWGEYENALFHGDREYIKDLLYQKRYLQAHYEWFESRKASETPRGVHAKTRLIAEKVGYKWEGGRSGMDNTPRGRTTPRAEAPRPNNPDMLWIDAICQQALSAELIAKLFEAVGNFDESKLWRARYEEKKQVVQSLYWDEQDRFFYDIDCNTHKFYRIKTTASFWPLTAGLATEEQAKAMARAVDDPKTFGGSVPLLSLARDDADFSPNGNYWRGSLWLPTAYAALKGLARYGHHKEAHEAACKILAHMQKTYEEFEPHTIWECYSPTKPAPAVNEHNDELVRPDFCGWSALGPIAIYIEFVLGFHRVDAFGGVVEWEKPAGMRGRIGIRNLRFGEVVTDIEAEGGRCRVRSNAAYTLRICGKDYPITEGEQEFLIS